MYFFALLLAQSDFVFAELQAWTLADGTTFEAELVATFPTEASFRSSQGKSLKIFPRPIFREVSAPY